MQPDKKPILEYQMPVGNGQFTTQRVYGPETPKPETPPAKAPQTIKKASKKPRRQ